MTTRNTSSRIKLYLILPGACCLCLNALADTPSFVRESLDSPDRREEDRARDANRHPAEVLEFFEIEPGMSVLDLFSGGGYYSEIVSRIVGAQGRVLAHNNEAYLAFVNAEVTGRYGDGRLANVTQLTTEANELSVNAGSIDAVLAILTWHDFYYVDSANNWPEIDTAKVVRALCSAVKPGGVLGVIDHVASAGSDPWESGQNLHRIDPQQIKADLSDSCFEYDGEIEVLRNAADDYSKSMGDPSIRGNTDRVAYRFRRR